MIYLDHNASTKPYPKAIEAAMLCAKDNWSNPSSTHRAGMNSRRALENARVQVAKLIGVKAAHLLWTSGGTESVHWALRGVLLPALGSAPQGGLVASQADHHAGYEAVRSLGQAGAPVGWVSHLANGQWDLDSMRAQIEVVAEQLIEKQQKIILVHGLWACNETGIIQPVEKILAALESIRQAWHKKGGAWAQLRLMSHFDGIQAAGKITLDIQNMSSPPDLVSLAAHKIGGLQGVGALYARSGIFLSPWQKGGGQEKALRGGTENTPACVAFGVAAEQAKAAVDNGDWQRIEKQRQAFEQDFMGLFPWAKVQFEKAPRLPNTSSLALPKFGSEAILIGLSEKGVCASAGAACASGSLEPSHVLLALGIHADEAHGALRISMGLDTSPEECQSALEALKAVVGRLEQVMPFH